MKFVLDEVISPYSADAVDVVVVVTRCAKYSQWCELCIYVNAFKRFRPNATGDFILKYFFRKEHIYDETK